MAVIKEIKNGSGGVIRIHDDYCKNNTPEDNQKIMTIFMLSNLYGSARVRNGHLNYQGSTAGITFNPGGVFEHELSWQSLAKNLIGKYGHKRPVKMATINAPEPAITLTESEAVKAFCEAYPEKLKTIMRICRRCKDNGEAAKAVQLEFAPCGFSAVGGYKVNYRFKSFSAGLEIEVNNEKVSMKYGRLIVEAKNLYDPLSPEFDVELKKPETKEDEGPVKCITGQSGSGLCGAAAYCDKKYTCCSQCPDDCNIRCGWIPEKSCQPAVETLDEKQQEDHSGDPAEMVKHLRNTDKIPDAWPEDLKDIPIPSITAINDILDDAEQDLNLSDEGLPVELAEVLNYTDADACKKSMETVKKAFQTAVEKAVDEKLKGGKPPKKAPETNTQEALEKQVYNLMMGNY